MENKTIAAVCAVFLAAVWFPSEAANVWQGVAPENKISGRMVSPGYLKGKVVLVDCRDYAAKTKENIEGIKFLQNAWAGYKTKPFVMLGSHRGNTKKRLAAAIAGRCNATYPIYMDAKVVDENGVEESVSNKSDGNFLYVYDATLQKRLYAGADPREAVGVAAQAIMAATTPMTPKQFEFLLDWEIENLPGQAFLRLKEYRSKFSEEPKKYDEAWARLSKDGEVVKLAKLVSLAEEVKDRDLNSKNAKRLTAGSLEQAMAKYAPLKDSADPNIVQEAKNALAELKWAAATLQ